MILQLLDHLQIPQGLCGTILSWIPNATYHGSWGFHTPNSKHCMQPKHYDMQFLLHSCR